MNKYISVNFPVTYATSVIRGHNKKFIIKFNNESMQPDERGDEYYFKYDSEKEISGNMQKRFASGFYSYLANKCGGNVVEDIPGEAKVFTSSKGISKDILKGVYSKSYKNDFHIYITFTLDEVLKPRKNENFVYNNEKRVFASVENSMRRLKSFLELQTSELDKVKDPYNPLFELNNLDEDLPKIQDDLVSVVMMDYAFLNNDRHTENIEFSVIFDENGDYHLVVSPIFDNDRSFGLDKPESKIIHDCQSPFARESYVNCLADVKYVIRDKDCDSEFSKQMNFENNYHSKVIADYIKNQCTIDGHVDMDLLKNNKLYQMYNNLKDIKVRQEFFDYLSELGSLDKINLSSATKEQEQQFLNAFNNKTNSTISMNHINEVEQNFNIRQSLLRESMQSNFAQLECPQMI